MSGGAYRRAAAALAPAAGMLMISLSSVFTSLFRGRIGHERLLSWVPAMANIALVTAIALGLGIVAIAIMSWRSAQRVG